MSRLIPLHFHLIENVRKIANLQTGLIGLSCEIQQFHVAMSAIVVLTVKSKAGSRVGMH